MVAQGITHLLVDIESENAGGDHAPPFMRDLISAEVHDSLFVPDMFVIRLRDPDVSWVNHDLCKLGNRVVLSVTGTDGAHQLIDGEITAIEVEYLPAPGGSAGNSGVGGPTLTLRGYDLSHRLHRDRKTRSFVQRSPAEIAEIVGRDAGLRVQADSCRPSPYLLQNNQTDWEFLWQLARKLGFSVCVRESVLHFSSRPEAPQTVELEWGSDLQEFRANLSTAEQVNEVIVRGWDVEAKREVTGRATEPTPTIDIGERRNGGDVSRAAFDFGARAVNVDSGISNQADADDMAQALLDEIAGAFIQAEGIASGQSKLTAGVNVSLSGLGDRFMGSYFVTECTHRYDLSGYSTKFIVSGRRSNALVDLLRDQSRAVCPPAIGIVTNNRDPRGMGRVKVRFPWLSGNDESDWARLAAPMAGDDRGFLFLPEVNDEVLVVFEHGDIHRPFVVGALWNGRDGIPEETSRLVNSTGEVNLRLIKSRTGHTVIFDDDAAGGGIRIIDGGGRNLIDIDTSSGHIRIQAQNDIELEAGGKLTLKGRLGVDIQSDMGEVGVKGQMVRLN